MAVATGLPARHSETIRQQGVVVMLAVVTRGLLLQLGRSVLGSTVKASGLTETNLAADARGVFDKIARDVDWPAQLPNQIYLVEMVLPVAAFYRALHERGWTQPDATRAVHGAFLATGDSQRRVFVLLMRSRLGARLFLRTLRPNWLGLTPRPANQWTVTRPQPDVVQIEVSRCYRLDAFRQVGTPEVAFVACHFEGHVMDVSPHIRVTWNGMATGAERCHYCFELLGRDNRQPVTSNRYLRQAVTS